MNQERNAVMTEAIPTWECHRCGMINYAHQRRCIVCSTMQRTPQSAPTAANVWECPACGMLNFAHQGLCITCGTAQPIIAEPVRTSAPPPTSRLPEPDLDALILADSPLDLPDLDALVEPPAAESPLEPAHATSPGDRRTTALALLTKILGGDSERAVRLIDGKEPVSVHDFLRRAPRYGTLIAAPKTWIKSDEQPIFVVERERDLTAYVTETSSRGVTPVEGVVVKAELYREQDERGSSGLVLFLDYEFQSPANRKRIDGVSLVPVSADYPPETLPSPGTRTIVGYTSDMVHDLL
jgi:hypothetical protein